MTLPFDGELDFAPPPPPRPGTRQAPLTVRQVNERADATLAEGIGPVWVQGELSRFTAHGSGPWYFTLKDGDAACISCTMFRGRNQAVKFRPKDGLEVLLLGTPHVYAPQGKMQLLVDALEPAGVGAAALALEQLRQKLAAEGLFDAQRRKPLPLLPRRIGIVTSQDGAALRDVLKVLRRRFAGVSVLLAPAAVQGAAAAAEIVRGLAALDRRGLDVLLLVRGGGAREDLAAFDDERVVRAVAACVTPVVTGVGHEIDTTLADFAADLRAPTPSAAAEAVVRERDELARRVLGLERALGQCIRHHLGRYRNRVLQARGARGLRDLPRRIDRARMDAAELQRRLETAIVRRVGSLRERLRAAERRLSPEVRLRRLAASRQRLESARALLGAAMQGVAARQRQRLGRAAATLDALSPLAVLGRGFALVTRGGPAGAIVRDADGLAAGDLLHIRLGRGTAEATVTAARPAPAPGPRRDTP